MLGQRSAQRGLFEAETTAVQISWPPLFIF